MTCYGALQEGATLVAYSLQRIRARNAGDEVLEAIFFHVAQDEAAHAGSYRSVLQLELGYDRDETIADLTYVLSRFKMPGDGLIPIYRKVAGIGCRNRPSIISSPSRLAIAHDVGNHSRRDEKRDEKTRTCGGIERAR